MNLISPLFLSVFLPLAMAGLFLLQKTRWVNGWLLLCSVAFLAFSSLSDLALIMALAFSAWALTLSGRGGAYMAAALQLLALIYFKARGAEWPLGLSFVSLQGIMYALTQKGKHNSLTDTLCYLTFFPKLSAGPLCAYERFASQKPAFSWENMEKGLTRLTLGLSKKLLLANQIYLLAMAGIEAGAHPAARLIALICCPLYVYYDFSGYTDMALGVARMMGLMLPENFNRPFAARSVRDFWRRWHITLSSFLRDYVYIKLGGSRKSRARTFMNLGAVFLLMGLWHGAALPYLIFALWHAMFVILEHAGAIRTERMKPAAARLYTLSVVAMGFVIFLTPDGAALAGLFSAGAPLATATALLSPVKCAALLTGLLLQAVRIKAPSCGGALFVWRTLIILLFILSYAAMLSGEYAPFLYARF